MPRLTLHLLGSPRVELDGEEVHISRRKVVALLAYLAVTGRSHQRDALATLLWPEHSASRANLRYTLSTLNRELGGDVVAACGRTLASAQAFGAGTAYDNVDAMLSAEKPDVVHVCSPNHFHTEHTIKAFKAGAHVMCEKPMATTLDECRRMIEAADKAKRVGAIAYCYRGYPLIRELRRRVQAGDFGALWRVSGLYLSQDVFDPERYV